MNITIKTAKPSIAPMKTLPSGQRVVVPLSKLFLSVNNVRSTNSPSLDGLKRLAAMIEADGLLADLHVSAETVKGFSTGRYAVEAGGRRWRALGMLVQAKKLDADTPIHCITVASQDATGVSLAENFGQESMSPADEYTAFAALRAEGRSIDAIARHFGVSSLHVQRRMKLAAVAPVLFEQFRAGKIPLDQMMVLASVDDQLRQVSAWNSLPDYNRSPYSLKRKLTEQEVIASDERVKLITLDRYKASGGTVRRDLFTDEVFLDDAGLVDLLVAEVLTEHAEPVRAEGWAWLEIIQHMGYSEREQYRQPPVRYLPEDDAARTRREALEARLSTLQEEYYEIDGADESEDESDEKSDALEAADQKCAAVQDEIDAARHALIDTSGYAKGQLGAIVTVKDGVVQVMRGYMTAEAAKAAAKANVRGGSDEFASSGSGSPVAQEFSERLTADMTSHRTAALQVKLCGNPQVALTVLAARMAEEVFGSASRYGSNQSPVRVSVKTCRFAMERDALNFSESAAAKALDAETERWTALMPQDSAQRFTWLLEQPQDVVVSLLAYCTAHSVDTVQRRTEENEQTGKIAQALKLDMSEFWTAGCETFFSHVSKAKLIEVVTEAVGAEAAKDLPKMKKPEAAIAAAAAVRDARWLPKALRLGAR